MWQINDNRLALGILTSIISKISKRTELQEFAERIYDNSFIKKISSLKEKSALSAGENLSIYFLAREDRKSRGTDASTVCRYSTIAGAPESGGLMLHWPLGTRYTVRNAKPV